MIILVPIVNGWWNQLFTEIDILLWRGCAWVPLNGSWARSNLCVTALEIVGLIHLPFKGWLLTLDSWLLWWRRVSRVLFAGVGCPSSSVVGMAFVFLLCGGSLLYFCFLGLVEYVVCVGVPVLSKQICTVVTNRCV